MPSSPPPPTTIMAADFVTPSRRTGWFGTNTDGASVTDEDSMHRAMCRKAELNLDYSGIVTPSKVKSFISFSTPDITSKQGNVGVKIGINENEFLFLLMS
jgi:hypothetical protein